MKRSNALPALTPIAPAATQSTTSTPSPPSPRAAAAKKRAAQRWYVYLIECRSGAIYTGIARDVAARYATHAAGTGARYTRANPPRALIAQFACPNQSIASRLEAAIKKLPAAAKAKLAGSTGIAVRRRLLA